MLIGEDYDKIEFPFYGYDFLEPNALYGDTFVALIGVYFAVLTARYYKQTNLIFFKHWKHFFYVFSIGFFMGGLGHFCYNYWGIPGKIPGWYLSGITGPYFVELAMASLLPKERYKSLKRFFDIKIVAIYIIQTLLIIFVDLEKEPGLGLIGPTLAMISAFPSSLGVLGYRFSKSITPSFQFLWWSLIVFSPSLFFQAFKINFHQWFDRNDVSHVLMLANITLYFLAVKGYFYFQQDSDKGKKSIEERGSFS
jgi:hypothetical protein